MDFSVRRAGEDDFNPALALAMRVFTEYEAPAYGPEGTATFHRDVMECPRFRNSLCSGENAMFCAFDREKLIGLVSSGRPGHISLLFVDGAFHRRGIATALLKEMARWMKEQGHFRITVNSSPYGVPFYHRFGFTDLSEEQKKDGILFTPMVYENSKECLDKAGQNSVK